MSKEYISLAQFPEDKKGVVYKINSGRNLERRLISMGVYRGIEIKKLNQSFGPVLVSINQTKLALGWGVANKIIIEYQNE